MSKAAGLVLILAGLGVGTFGLAQSDDAGPQAVAAQSPTSGPLARGAILKGGAAPVPQHAAQAARFPSPVVTIVTRPTVEPRTPPERFAIPKGRDAIARELQKELRRVGCYEGEISGIWSPSTRRAMSTFIERMNARLPIEEPDAVLFAMVKGQHGTVCGKACPAGEAQSTDGRCVPAFLLAQAKSKPRPASVTTAGIEKPAAAIVGWLPNPTPQSVDPPMTEAASKHAALQFVGRMGLAGPPVGPTLAPTLGSKLGSTLAPPPGTTTRVPRYRATQAGASTAHPRVGQGGQRWSRAIFSQKMSNN